MSIIRLKISETPVPGKPLGRHIHTDSRSANFPAETASAVVSVTHASHGLPLTQARGSCTAEALCGALNSVPHFGTGAAGQKPLTQPDADTLYNAEIVLEGGNPATDDPGGSGTEVCQAAKNAGMLRAYQHASDIHSALAALVLRPVITGVDWYEGFDNPDANGLVKISGAIRGGHEFLANEIDAVNELVWFPNSWGPGWGVARGTIPGGCFCMSFSTWETLLSNGGDCTIPRSFHGWKAL